MMTLTHKAATRPARGGGGMHRRNANVILKLTTKVTCHRIRKRLSFAVPA
jgi:hypothetical protein